MKVKIDYDLCMGDRNCNKLCPEVFDYDADQLQARIKVDEVPEHLQDLVRQAAAECAPGAIIVEDRLGCCLTWRGTASTSWGTHP